MFLSTLLVVGFCLTEVLSRTMSPPFDFREHCYVQHSRSKYSAKCNDSNERIKVLLLDKRSTSGISEMDLMSFTQITLDFSVQVSKITIKNTKKVQLIINSSGLQNLIVDNVDELTLIYRTTEKNTEDKETLFLSNISKLVLVSEEEFLWSFRLVKLNNIQDIGLGLSKLIISGANLTIVESNVLLEGKSSLSLNVISARIEKSILYIHENGCLNVTADQLHVQDTKISLEKGTIHLINSKEVTFFRNSLYGFEKKSLSVNTQKTVQFVENDIFASDLVSVLSFGNNKVTYLNNKFGCNNCAVKQRLLVEDLRDMGEVNFCYTNCNMTLNHFKELLNQKYFCNQGESEVNHKVLCDTHDTNTSSFNTVGLLWWILFVILLLFGLVFLLLFYIFHKNKSRKFKSMVVRRSLPQELECGRTGQQLAVSSYSNDCYDTALNSTNCENIYESVDPPGDC